MGLRNMRKYFHYMPLFSFSLVRGKIFKCRRKIIKLGRGMNISHRRRRLALRREAILYFTVVRTSHVNAHTSGGFFTAAREQMCFVLCQPEQSIYLSKPLFMRSICSQRSATEIIKYCVFIVKLKRVRDFCSALFIAARAVMNGRKRRQPV